jgi:NhaP-type Na+/H+ or K+/H+ antiporter/Trk K+ transport system NAD-binding subunit
MTPHDLLLMTGLVVVAGLSIHISAQKLGIPSIIFLLAGGIILGPEVLGIVQPSALGSGLTVLVSLIVALIVFEGGFVLDADYLRSVSRPVRNLITLGCAITFVLAALAAYFIAGLSWPLAWLFGSLVSVTGPTVINPLMRIANANQRVTVVLMAEGILIDAVGAILAVVVLEFLLAEHPASLLGASWAWLSHLGFGIGVGGFGGWLAAWLLKRLKPDHPEPARLGTLAAALAIYLLAEAVIPESGIAAAAAGGIVMGNQALPFADRIRNFKGDLTMLGLSVLFILLAARLRFEDLASLGVPGVLTVVFLMVVVRPLGAWLSTLNTGLKRNERIFIAAIGPRGVVAASVTTFAAIQLDAVGYEGTSQLVGLVFLTVIMTVVIQGAYARTLAQRLGVVPMNIIVLGSDEIAVALAERLQTHGEDVVLVDVDAQRLEPLQGRGFNLVQTDLTTTRGLEQAGIRHAKTLVAATASDKTNMLVCQLARTKFGLQDLVARANHPDTLDTFEALGIRAMSPLLSSAILLENLVRRPNTLSLFTEMDPSKEVAEITVQNQAMTRRALKDLNLPGDCLISMVRRGGATFIPDGQTVLQVGDTLTLMGSAEPVAEATASFESP